MKTHRKVLSLNVPARIGFVLVFGTWEQIFYGEWDGRRAQRILIKIIGD